MPSHSEFIWLRKCDTTRIDYPNKANKMIYEKSMHNETITLSLPLFGTSNFQKRKDSCFILFLTPICNNLFLNYFTNNWKNPVFYKVIQITPVCQVFKRFFVDILSTKSKKKTKKQRGGF